jgi:hypothetical protein
LKATHACPVLDLGVPGATLITTGVVLKPVSPILVFMTVVVSAQQEPPSKPTPLIKSVEVYAVEVEGKI